MWNPWKKKPKPLRLELDNLLHKDFVVCTIDGEFKGRVMSVMYNSTQWDLIFSKKLTKEIIEVPKHG